MRYLKEILYIHTCTTANISTLTSAFCIVSVSKTKHTAPASSHVTARSPSAPRGTSHSQHSPLAEGVRRAVGAHRRQVLGLFDGDVQPALGLAALAPQAAVRRRVLEGQDDVPAVTGDLLLDLAL